jgi:hypothetical protein
MSADPYDHDPDAMQGYVALIGAILQRALADSRLRVRHGNQGHTHPTRGPGGGAGVAPEPRAPDVFL